MRATFQIVFAPQALKGKFRIYGAPTILADVGLSKIISLRDSESCAFFFFFQDYIVIKKTKRIRALTK